MAVAITEEAVIVGGEAGLQALRPSSGDVLWSLDTEGPVKAPPIVVGDIILVGTQQPNRILGVGKDGVEQWSIELDSAPSAPMAFSGSRLFVPTEQNITALTSDPNHPPKPAISYSPESPRSGEEVTFSGGDSNDDERIVQYH
jgi:outer membrane protein assembly factor BamB